MIDILLQLGAGFVNCLTPLHLAMLAVGIVIGLLVGVLPGLTLVMGVTLALTHPLASFALRFSSPEYFAILVFGLTSVVALGRGSLGNALISLALGLLIASVGTDPIYGAYRFTFGSAILADGIEFLVVMVGAYGVGEVLSRLE